jgi:hypothetical protein
LVETFSVGGRQFVHRGKRSHGVDLHSGGNSGAISFTRNQLSMDRSRAALR